MAYSVFYTQIHVSADGLESFTTYLPDTGPSTLQMLIHNNPMKQMPWYTLILQMRKLSHLTCPRTPSLEKRASIQGWAVWLPSPILDNLAAADSHWPWLFLCQSLGICSCIGLPGHRFSGCRCFPLLSMHPTHTCSVIQNPGMWLWGKEFPRDVSKIKLKFRFSKF